MKTYPHPSVGSLELVCCAGITLDYELLRIYPVDFRYRPKPQQFAKYQWIDVDLAPRPRNKDLRKESWQPRLSTLKVGNCVNTGRARDWAERLAIVDQVPHRTLRELEALYEEDRTSLGIIRPTECLDLEIVKCSEKWSPKHETLLKQASLFGERPKLLHKIPYTFRYVFRCEDNREPHRCPITDWELGMLFLRQREKHGEAIALRHVRERFLDQMCSEKRDTRFFVGTMIPRNQWLVLGVFWPPKPN